MIEEWSLKLREVEDLVWGKFEGGGSWQNVEMGRKKEKKRGWVRSNPVSYTKDSVSPTFF